MATKKLIVAATSARAFAQAAVACAYEVIALDAFADADTQAICARTFKLKFNDNVVDEADFKRVFLSLNLKEIEGFCYGSLFDNCPHLLAWVAHRVRLVGNVPEVMRIAKSVEFFKLLDGLNIQHPETYLSQVQFDRKLSQSSFPRKRESMLTLKTDSKKMDSRFRGNDGVGDDWLCKQIGGSGGTHIRPANQFKLGDYFQRKIAGTSISMLFVADGKAARTLGFNEQFVAPTAEVPYRFAGAVSGLTLQPNIHAAFEHAAQQLTKALNLCGLNNLDAMLDGEKLWILELNPRLSANFSLYENTFSQHLKGCAGDLGDYQAQKITPKAQLILYADDAFEIPANFVWPTWARDIPCEPRAKIAQNAPICSVFAQAENAEIAQSLVRQRAEKLREFLNK